MTANGGFAEHVPLAVILFHEAMVRNQSLSQFASELEIGTLSLRQLMVGKTQHPRQKTLQAVCAALGMEAHEVVRRMELVPYETPLFEDWLDRQMVGRYTRSKLASTTGISDGALRNYLNGRTLPDADQALRLAEVLEVPPLELATIVVANQVRQAGGTLAAPPIILVNEGEAEADGWANDDDQFVAAPTLNTGSYDEAQLLGLWRQLHPQGRRATLGYIAMLLAER